MIRKNFVKVEAAFMEKEGEAMYQIAICDDQQSSIDELVRNLKRNPQPM